MIRLLRGQKHLVVQDFGSGPIKQDARLRMSQPGVGFTQNPQRGTWLIHSIAVQMERQWIWSAQILSWMFETLLSQAPGFVFSGQVFNFCVTTQPVR